MERRIKVPNRTYPHQHIEQGMNTLVKQIRKDQTKEKEVLSIFFCFLLNTSAFFFLPDIHKLKTEKQKRLCPQCKLQSKMG